MDGVIVDSNPWHKKSLREFCERHGYHFSDEYLKEHIFGRTNKDWIPVLFGDIPESRIRELANEKETLFRDLYKDHIKPITGLLPFLQALNEHLIPMAIATSAPADNVSFTLSHTGIGKYFEVILDESAILNGKPDPEVYQKTAHRIGYAPENCIVIEDSLSGVESARRAGCTVIGITTTHSSDEFRYTIRNIDDFTQLQIQDLNEIMHAL
jgi:HAD superfamily hydrolase (TIGR01509 family)